MASMMFRIVRTRGSLFKCNYLKNEKFSVNFLFNLWNLHEVLNIFLKKKIVIANILPKLQTVKDLIRPLFKKRRFRTSFDSQQVKGSQKLVKSSWEHFYHILPSLWREKIGKISPVSKFDISGAFVNTLTPDYKYSVLDSKNLPFPIQTQLS